METLMIHDIRQRYFDLDLSRCALAFDDALYSQYYYLPLFEKIETPRLYFVATNFVRPGGRRALGQGPTPTFAKSRRYMYEAFVENDFGLFMTVEELARVCAGKNVVVGAHSHFHDVVLTRHPLKKPLSSWKRARIPVPAELEAQETWNRRSKLAFRGYSISGGVPERRSKSRWEDFVKFDTESCLEWFEKNLGMRPETYAFPFNEYTPELVEILKTYGFKTFYDGRSGDGVEIVNRVDVDSVSPAPKNAAAQVKATSPSQ